MIQKRHGTTISTYRRTHPTIWKPSSPWSGKSVEDNLAILWKIWMWIWRLWHEFKICRDSCPEKQRSWSVVKQKPLSRAYQYSTAKVYVFSDSVLCLGRMRGDPIESWKKQIHWYSENNHFKEMESNRWHADGVQVENIHRNHNVGPPREDSKSNERLAEKRGQWFEEYLHGSCARLTCIICEMLSLVERLAWLLFFNATKIAWLGRKDDTHNSRISRGTILKD